MEKVRVIKEGWYRGRRIRPGEILEVPEEDLPALMREGKVEWLLEVPVERVPPVSEVEVPVEQVPPVSEVSVELESRPAPEGAPRREVVVVTTLERLLEDFRREEERTRRVGEVLEVARKLVEMGWIENEFGQPEVREGRVELPRVRLKQRYSLGQIEEWSGTRISLRVGTLEDLPPYPGRGDRWEKLRRLGFETVVRGDKVLARKVLVTCGSAGAWLEAE